MTCIPLLSIRTISLMVNEIGCNFFLCEDEGFTKRELNYALVFTFWTPLCRLAILTDNRATELRGGVQKVKRLVRKMLRLRRMIEL